MAYAGFWLRFVAILIDGVLFSIAMWPVGLALNYGLMSGLMDPAQMQQLSEAEMLAAAGAVMRNAILVGVVEAIASLVYFAAMESSKYQATLGKLAVGIRVTDASGARISFLHSIGRNLGKYLSVAILMIGFLMAAFSERKQALHDKMAGTLVVKKTAGPA